MDRPNTSQLRQYVIDVKSVGDVFLAWRSDNSEPWLVDIDGKCFLPFFRDRALLDAMIPMLDIPEYVVHRVYDLSSFLAFIAARAPHVTPCFDLRVLTNPIRVRYSEIQPL